MRAAFRTSLYVLVVVVMAQDGAVVQVPTTKDCNVRLFFSGPFSIRHRLLRQQRRAFLTQNDTDVLPENM